ncbi:MAG: 23S rRNA (adenine(2030)-N(6))-methyltransferase RlmJ [Pseudomonadales bacterium]|nr:23S rRNA (adenine(2030)-N(6))-methyltransferase RlmJ [Pseudomonadales bacterium]
MLSYRHGFHAGNHADILKHLTLLALLDRLLDKQKPFSVIDTHAGRGIYDLGSDEARKTGEAEAGVGRLWQSQSTDPLLSQYLQLLSDFNPGSQLRRYPGSPAVIQSLLRADDRLSLIELHAREVALLRQNFHTDSRLAIHERDGFEGVLALCPPTPRRGLVLMDPPYEVKTDYRQVLSVCEKLHRKWSTGIIAVWYPLLGRARDQGGWLCERFAQKKFPALNRLELTVGPQAEDLGMHGSGMLIINTPWQLPERMEAALQQLPTWLGDATKVRVEQL